MPRFLLLALVAVTAVVGPGLLDLGPRLWADPIYYSDLGSSLDAGTGGIHSETAEVPAPPSPEAWPAPPVDIAPSNGMCGASSPSGSGGGPGVPAGLLGAVVCLSAPQQVASLRATAVLGPLSTFTSSIFRPPRVSG